MDFLLDLIRTAAPLLAATTGALVSELAGVMAVFADGFVNLGAFLCYTFVFLTGNVAFGIIACVMICVALAFVAALLTNKMKANPFLTGLALNVSVSGVTSLLSVQIFGTRGVLSPAGFDFPVAAYDGVIFCTWSLVALAVLVLVFTKPGLYLRTSGASPEVLVARGVNPVFWQVAGWCVAGAFSALAGCVLVIRLSSYVPNISAGCGWTALAAVFLGRKRIAGVGLAVMVFTLAEYAANNAQNIPLLASIPSSVLLSMPYFIALLLIAFGFSRKRD